MTVGATEVFEKVKQYLQKNYPDLESFTMPYCSLYESVLEKKKYYRVQVNFKRKGDILTRSAILQANSETGAIEMFKEGFTWTYWI